MLKRLDAWYERFAAAHDIVRFTRDKSAAKQRLVEELHMKEETAENWINAGLDDFTYGEMELIKEELDRLHHFCDTCKGFFTGLFSI